MEKNNAKKWKKKSRKLEKELYALRKEMSDIQKQVVILSTEKKRKREEPEPSKKSKKKKKEEGKRKRAKPTPVSEVLPSTPVKRTEPLAKGVKVNNPFSPGYKMTVRDGSAKNNRSLNKVLRAYNNLAPGPEKERYLENLGQMFAESIEKGNVEFDTSIVPREVLDRAASIYRAKTGNEVTLEDEEASDPGGKFTASSSETDLPMPSDSFQGNMLHWIFKFSNDDKKKGFIESLTGIAPKLYKILYSMLRKFKSCRFYLEYVVEMGRGFVEVQDSNEPERERLEHMEIREVKLSSSAGGQGLLETISKRSDVETKVSRSFENLLQAVSEYNELGSGHVFLAAKELHLYVNKMVYKASRTTEKEDPVDGEATEEIEKAGSWMALPKWVTARYAAINPKPVEWKRDDDRCFEWCILRALHPWEKSGAGTYSPGIITDLYQYKGEVKLPQGVNYPIPLEDKALTGIELLNDISFSIFSIGKEEGEIRPVYISEHKSPERKHILLGLLSEGETYHFVLLKSLSSLLGFSKNNHKRFFCERCITAHKTLENLQKHVEICGKHEPCRISMPNEGSASQFISFKSWHQLMPVPFVGYLDFESVIAPDGRHLPSAYCYHIKCHYPEHEKIIGAMNKPVGEVRMYAGEDCMDHFFRNIFEDTQVLYDFIQKKDEPYVAQDGDEKDFKSATHCHICKLELGGDRHLDHDHFTGKYRGAAHPGCNQHYTAKKLKAIPFVIHNLKGYDGYHILSHIHTRLHSVNTLGVIAKNLEKFTCITINYVRFIDSFQFMQGSLENMVANLHKSLLEQGGGWPVLKEAFPEVFKLMDWECKGFDLDEPEPFVKLHCADVIKNVLAKGVYPYEWMDSFEKMKLTSLPPVEAFFSKLSDSGITPEDWKRGTRMWEWFGCKNMQDYTLLYCKLDVLLLESLFEVFRKTSMSSDSDGLDPAHFVTAPSLSWSSMLKMNYNKGIVIENMTDYEMFLMVEDGIRGGMCQVLRPYARSNIVNEEDLEDPLLCDSGGEGPPDEEEEEDENSGPFVENAMKPTFDFSRCDSRILYLDANNLYGWAMKQFLPLGDYRWEYKGKKVSQDEEKGKEKVSFWEDPDAASQFIVRVDAEASRGFILEVDLDYPEELHDQHNSYPFCAQSKVPQPSAFTLQELDRLGLGKSRGKGVPKLVMDLEPKRNYVIHYRNLAQALKNGLILKKVHRVISFKQAAWLNDYIEFNTKKRQSAKNSIEKDYFKLKNNSIFGKTMEDLRKRRDIKFFTEKNFRRALAMASGPYCKHWRIITRDKLMIMELARHNIQMNRPVILGQAILDLSKWLMYDFHYRIMQPAFGVKATVNYTDTDSLVYFLQGDKNKTVNMKLIEIQKEHNCFDLSEIKNKEHPMLQQGWNVMENKAIPGKFKDELFGFDAEEFIALRSKMYSVKMMPVQDAPKDKMKMKGIPAKAKKVVDKERLVHEDYMASFMGAPVDMVSFNVIGHSKTFQLESREIKKVGLSPCDDKSYYINAVQLYRYGHKTIGQIEALRGEMAKMLEVQDSVDLEYDEDDESISFINAEFDKMENERIGWEA